MEQTVAAGRRPLQTAQAVAGDGSGRGGWALLRVQLLSGMGASVVSAFALTPFDVVKTRLQVLDSAVGCGNGTLSIQGCCVHPAALVTGGNKGSRPSSVQMLGCMVRNEGLPSLWRGSAFGMVAAVPSVGMYMVLYERIKGRVQGGPSGHDRPWAPMVSGAAARSLATLGTSPLELVRIRLMAQRGKKSVGSFAVVSAVVREKGWLALWKGIGPSLYRDVPFSAIYWMLAETLRSRFNVRSFPCPRCRPVLSLRRFARRNTMFFLETFRAVVQPRAGGSASKLTLPHRVLICPLIFARRNGRRTHRRCFWAGQVRERKGGGTGGRVRSRCSTSCG